MHLYMLEADCLPSEKSQAHCQEEKAAIKKSKRWGEEKKKSHASTAQADLGG